MHRRIAIRRQYFFKILDQHNYCKESFLIHNIKSGLNDWNMTTVKTVQRTPWKCAFHLVRALVFTLEAFSEMEAV